jgi:two-component system cell cycle response regulator
VTTEAIAPARPMTAAAEGELVRLFAAVAELEVRPVSALRTLTEPATAIMHRAEELGDQELLQRAKLLVISVIMREGQIEEGGRQAHRSLAWAEQHGSSYLQARAHREVSLFHRLVGDVSSAHTHALQALSCLPDDADIGIRARHLLTLAIALDENGHSADGDRRFTESLDIAMALGDGELIAQILNNMAYTAFERDDEPAARAFVEQMRDTAAERGFPLSAGQLDTIARIQMMSGDFDGAAATLRAVLEPDSKVAGNEGDAYATCLLTMAEALRIAERYDEAQEALDAGAALAEERNLKLIRAQFREGQAVLYADTGRYREAYEEHRVFYAEAAALHSAQREARAHALQAAYDATEARRVSEQLRELAHRDALTGLYNRRYVDERLPALLGEAATRRTPISVAIVDLDHFKRINDTLSHSTGDSVLRQIGELLNASVSGRTFAARLGGEEFLLIMPGVDAPEAQLRCEELRQRISGHDWSGITAGLPVTTSIGVTTAPEGRATVSDLLARADQFLYAAKHAGRDRVLGG